MIQAAQIADIDGILGVLHRLDHGPGDRAQQGRSQQAVGRESSSHRADPP